MNWQYLIALDIGSIHNYIFGTNKLLNRTVISGILVLNILSCNISLAKGEQPADINKIKQIIEEIKSAQLNKDVNLFLKNIDETNKDFYGYCRWYINKLPTPLFLDYKICDIHYLDDVTIVTIKEERQIKNKEKIISWKSINFKKIQGRWKIEDMVDEDSISISSYNVFIEVIPEDNNFLARTQLMAKSRFNDVSKIYLRINSRDFSIRVRNIKINGKSASFITEPKGLYISLEEPLLKKEEVKVEMVYEVKLKNFSPKKGVVYMRGGWCPWLPNQYKKDSPQVIVSVKTPKGWEVISVGKKIEEKSSQDRVAYVFDNTGCLWKSVFTLIVGKYEKKLYKYKNIEINY